jgi:hypothetical protein
MLYKTWGGEKGDWEIMEGVNVFKVHCTHV